MRKDSLHPCELGRFLACFICLLALYHWVGTGAWSLSSCQSGLRKVGKSYLSLPVLLERVLFLSENWGKWTVDSRKPRIQSYSFKMLRFIDKCRSHRRKYSHTSELIKRYTQQVLTRKNRKSTSTFSTYASFIVAPERCRTLCASHYCLMLLCILLSAVHGSQKG